MRSGVILGLLSLLAIAAVPAAATAHEADLKPIIIINDKPVDPAAFPWLSEAAAKSLANAMQQQKAGASYAFVFAAAPSGASAYSYAPKATFVSVEDLAVRTLQECEFLNTGTPCYIVSVSGHDAEESGGGLPLQPRLLSHQPRRFDAWRVPFVSAADRFRLNGYARTAGPRALLVTPDGWWSYNGGKTVFDAIAAVYASCTKQNPNAQCLLYAVDDQVVFAPDQPQ